MGDRADFYVGRGKDAEWLGSIAWDGYPEALRGSPMLAASSEGDFRAAVAGFLSAREDATVPDQGWPWPWTDSRLTDLAVAFDEGRVWASSFGYAWFDPLLPEPERGDDAEKVAVFPDMTSRQRVTFGPRSGVVLLGLPR